MRDIKSFNPKEQSALIKEEFILLLEDFIEKQEKSTIAHKLHLTDKQVSDLQSKVFQFKSNCDCGICIDEKKIILSNDIFDDIISIAVEKVENKKYV